MKVAIVGTVGVPARYGGFETLVENIIGDNCTSEIQYTVYCSGKSYAQKKNEYKGALLKYVPLKANGVQSIPYDIISILRAIGKSDIVLILGISGCVILPFVRLFTKKPIVVNIDGLEHRRNKWGPKVRKFLKWSEQVAIKYASKIIVDNKAIQDYVKSEYNKESVLIAYGGDHVQCDVQAVEEAILAKNELLTGNYSFSVCRIEPENNVHVILETFALSKKVLVFVGNWNNSEYGRQLLLKYGNCQNIIMLHPIYDIPTLNVLRSNCCFYLHGHSAGGTNPSLVEAMFFCKPIFAFDCTYNRESTENQACYFKDIEDLKILINLPFDFFEEYGNKMREIAHKRYRWKMIAQQYEGLYFSLI